VLQREAIALAEKSLGAMIGRRYKDVVLRCLKGDFGVERSTDESRWLRAFNWLVVKEIEKCCA
jgi:hypothetical protein